MSNFATIGALTNKLSSGSYKKKKNMDNFSAIFCVRQEQLDSQPYYLGVLVRL